MGILDIVPAGVVQGKDVYKVFDYAREHHFAIPSFNVTSSSTAVAVMEAARDAKSPIMVQVSNGGAAYWAGKGVDNKDQKASIAGAIAAAHYVRQIAPLYGIPVIMHSDHCAKKLLPWFDGMLEADKAYFKQHGIPLFSSHMLDLSEESKEENIQTCKKYLKEMAPMGIWLEMEFGITGGEEDGVNNEHVSKDELFTSPQDIWDIYREFSEITPNFSIAAAFGNVHGSYAPGNVQLRPDILREHQEYVRKQTGTTKENPVFLVFHGGSGSTKEEIHTAVKNGVVKMNVDTDTQFAYLEGIRDYCFNKKPYLMSQVGNPEGADKPNKKFYDPRVWVREGEKTMSKRVVEALQDLHTVNTL